jgi:hypothetical protein
MVLSEDLNSIPRLLGDAVEQLGKLVQNETELARAELSEKITQAGIGAGYVVAAAVCCVPVIVLLLIALALWLVELGLAPISAHLAAAGVGAIACGILVVTGFQYLKPKNLSPDVTLQEIEKDVATMKGLVK